MGARLLSQRSWTISVADTNSTMSPADTSQLLASLKLSSFTEDELRARFSAADQDGDGSLSRAELKETLKAATVGKSCAREVDSRAATLTTQLLRSQKSISLEDIKSRGVELA